MLTPPNRPKGWCPMSDIDPIAPHGGSLVNLLVGGAEADALRQEAANLPKLVVSERELSDLEMLAVGALSPLTGFQGERDYHSILDSMHLQNGLAWSIPVTLVHAISLSSMYSTISISPPTCAEPTCIRMWYLAPGLLLDRGEDLPHREACASAEIEAAAGMSFEQQFQRSDMRGRKISNVDIVANRGAVGCVVVVAEDGEVADMSL